MQYAACCVPVSALRKEPLHIAEMVTQQLFGECCTIIQSVQGWSKIKCKYDGYEGWCLQGHLAEIDEEQFLFKKEKLTDKYLTKVIYNGLKMYVPLASSMATFNKHKAQWQSDVCTYKGSIYNPSKTKISKKGIKFITANYINSPYLWGGKSVFGIDCSGFSQAVYKFFNIYLPRDSWQQAEQGDIVKNLGDAHCGDLCFFNNEEGKITHVGILLNQRKIIHSSVKVRIDDIDEKGIINSDSKQLTHSLKVIKRYFEV